VPPSDESKLDEKSQILVFSHGNASDILSMLPWAEHVAFLSGRFVVLYDYEGYGLSSGSPSESGCYQSLAKVIDYLIKQFRVNKEQMLLMGESLGTGVVVHYAWENKWIKPIVLISPYKTIVSVAIDSFMHTPMDQFESISKISELQCPVKIYHGKKDQLIPVEHARALLSKLPQQYYIAPTYFKNADHDNILSFIHPMELVAYF
jgi:pimeloyl-ACP methyl ester carboxylesterase